MPTKAINLRIDTELLEYLQKRADKEHRTLSNMIISILLTEKEMGEFEQEPCEDAISREAVIKLAYDMSEIDGEHFSEPRMVVDVEDIQKLSSVTPIVAQKWRVKNDNEYSY